MPPLGERFELLLVKFLPRPHTWKRRPPFNGLGRTDDWSFVTHSGVVGNRGLPVASHFGPNNFRKLPPVFFAADLQGPVENGPLNLAFDHSSPRRGVLALVKQCHQVHGRGLAGGRRGAAVALKVGTISPPFVSAVQRRGSAG